MAVSVYGSDAGSRTKSACGSLSYIIGISSGASLGATVAVLVSFGANTFLVEFGLAFGASDLDRWRGSDIGEACVFRRCGRGFLQFFSNLVINFASTAEGIKTVAFWAM
ncbi:MAG: hypothetical protein ACE3JK_10610 [Sporolactobacillus sp.]